MSTLTTANDALIPAAAGAKSGSARKSFLRTMYDAMIESRQRRAEREIASYIASRGGLLNDEMEREIMRRMNGRSTNLSG